MIRKIDSITSPFFGIDPSPLRLDLNTCLQAPVFSGIPNGARIEVLYSGTIVFTNPKNGTKTQIYNEDLNRSLQITLQKLFPQIYGGNTPELNKCLRDQRAQTKRRSPPKITSLPAEEQKKGSWAGTIGKVVGSAAAAVGAGLAIHYLQTSGEESLQPMCPLPDVSQCIPDSALQEFVEVPKLVEVPTQLLQSSENVGSAVCAVDSSGHCIIPDLSSLEDASLYTPAGSAFLELESHSSSPLQIGHSQPMCSPSDEPLHIQSTALDSSRVNDLFREAAPHNVSTSHAKPLNDIDVIIHTENPPYPVVNRDGNYLNESWLEYLRRVAREKLGYQDSNTTRTETPPSHYRVTDDNFLNEPGDNEECDADSISYCSALDSLNSPLPIDPIPDTIRTETPFYPVAEYAFDETDPANFRADSVPKGFTLDL